MPKRPKLGQHFLQDPEVLDRIAGSAVASGDTAVEIGPGRGALTKCLLRLASRVVAVEIDAGLARDLPRACGHSPRLQVVEADALRVNLASLPGDAKPDRSVLAGNLPYYITSPVLRAVFAARGAFRCATFLVQRVVAEGCGC